MIGRMVCASSVRSPYSASLPLRRGQVRSRPIGVIITALGNDLQVQYVDKAGAEAAMAGTPTLPGPHAGDRDDRQRPSNSRR